ncbi:MAG TPA: hypothetical protein VEC60_04040, partial [Reyranella sp.]|nr:hypothetical protein [Reyranella sp.]
DGVDVRNLAIEVVNGHVLVKGTVPSTDELERLAGLLRRSVDQATSIDCEVSVRRVAPSDSEDGRGRSPITGTSADSAHESRHQLDRS